MSFCQKTGGKFLGPLVDFSGLWVDFSGPWVDLLDLLGHHLAGFKVPRWQTSGPRGPNIMSTFMHVAGVEGGLWEATKVLLNLSAQGLFTIKKQ